MTWIGEHLGLGAGELSFKRRSGFEDRPAASGRARPIAIVRVRHAAGIKDQQVADRLLTPFNHEVGKGERYYAQLAVNRSAEAILKGQRRLLLTMATGTGKTAVAFQLCRKLWNARWNRTGEYRRPRILYFADRNILVDQPKDGIFAAFGDARYKIESGEVVQSREMYFAIYQALAEDHLEGLMS